MFRCVLDNQYTVIIRVSFVPSYSSLASNQIEELLLSPPLAFHATWSFRSRSQPKTYQSAQSLIGPVHTPHRLPYLYANSLAIIHVNCLRCLPVLLPLLVAVQTYASLSCGYGRPLRASRIKYLLRYSTRHRTAPVLAPAVASRSLKPRWLVCSRSDLPVLTLSVTTLENSIVSAYYGHCLLANFLSSPPRHRAVSSAGSLFVVCVPANLDKRFRRSNRPTPTVLRQLISHITSRIPQSRMRY